MLGFRSHNVCEDSKFKVKGKFGEEERRITNTGIKQ